MFEKYRLNLSVVEATKISNENIHDLSKILPHGSVVDSDKLCNIPDRLYFDDANNMYTHAEIGDWICKIDDKFFYALKENVFKSKYVACPKIYTGLFCCSFCGESTYEKLLAGPNVFICDSCIDACNKIINGDIQ